LTSSTGGFRSQSPNSKKSRWRANLFLSTIVVVMLIIGIAAWTTDNYLWRLPATHGNSHPRAVVMDQLSLNYPDPSFTTNITNALKASGYSVDYSGPSSNAVDSFRQLPSQDYNLIIIRAHTGSGQSIITAEPYSKSEFVTDQLAGKLVPAQVDGGPLYFAITPKFVRQDMAGTFPDSTILVMGCSALQGTQDIASAFLDKGANFFVGWDSSVSIIHTDTSTVAFVELLASGKSLPQATAQAGGADPVYGSRLQYLDWETLVQGRANMLFSRLIVWVFLASILIIGPMVIFVAPKFITSLDDVRERLIFQRGRKPPKSPTGRQEERTD
jgi:hypothetical protein